MYNYIYISSRKNIKEYLYDNFKNIIFIKPNPYKFQLKRIIKKIRKDNISQVIIENYFVGIKGFIHKLNKLNITVKMVWTNGLATLNEEIELTNLLEIIELLKKRQIKSLAFTEKNIYYVYQDLKGVKQISLTVKSKETAKNKSDKLIGVYGISDNWVSNVFNQLSAIKMLDDYSVVMINMKKIGQRFCKFFNINYFNYNKKLNVKNFRELLKYIKVSACIEFTNMLDLFVIDSFNYGVPCVVGNNTLFFDDTLLKEIVIVKSDDDINEIHAKLTFCLNNIKNIIAEYEKVKKIYDINSRESIKIFIEV